MRLNEVQYGKSLNYNWSPLNVGFHSTYSIQKKEEEKKLGIFIEKKTFKKLPQTKGKTGHNKPTVKTNNQAQERHPLWLAKKHKQIL